MSTGVSVRESVFLSRIRDLRDQIPRLRYTPAHSYTDHVEVREDDLYRLIEIAEEYLSQPA